MSSPRESSPESPRYAEAGKTIDFTPEALVTICFETGAPALLVDSDALPDEFFDLSTKVAGETLHALTKYGLRLAAVVDERAESSQSFRDFVHEANRGHQFRFFATRADAISWLETFGRS